jgi:hypothetical protein
MIHNIPKQLHGGFFLKKEVAIKKLLTSSLHNSSALHKQGIQELEKNEAHVMLCPTKHYYQGVV